jgi:carboxyl-terminal processing protease
MTIWDEIVEEVVDSGVDTVILDLRGNPGGYFNAAVWAAGDFLEEGSIVAKQVDRDGNEALFKVERDGNLLNVELVVLVDEGSASASEILAGALQFHDRGYVIGENTFGKGTAQEIVDYGGGSSLHITTLNWVLPDGRVLSKEEVINPDNEVEYDEEDFIEGEDPQLDAAYEYLGVDR